MIKIVNLTPHDVTLNTGLMQVIFPPSGNVARVESKSEGKFIPYAPAEGIILKLPTVNAGETTISGLPEKKLGTYYIVSNYVAQIARREDLLAPNTDSSAERDENGAIKSIRQFQQYL